MKKYVQTIVTMSILLACNTSMAVNRFIIKYKLDHVANKQSTETDKSLLRKLSSGKIHHLSQKAHEAGHKENQARISHQIASGAHVAILDNHLDKKQIKKFIAGVQEDSNVEYIEEDRIMKAASVPVQANPDWQWDMMTLG